MTAAISVDLQDRAKELALTIREGLLHLVDHVSPEIHQGLHQALASVDAASSGDVRVATASNALRALLGHRDTAQPDKALTLAALALYDKALADAMAPTDPVKLVIWDLDNTFWKGTLAEGDELEIPAANIDTIKSLTQRGIVNAICSKNNHDAARSKLEQIGIWEYFVFPRIAFTPKGEMIKDIIERAQLRPENVLFVDDNELNLDEARYYNHGLQTLHADELSTLLARPALKGKPDGGQRLAQYKLLEQRANERLGASSNEAFLRQSDIRLQLTPTKLEEAERVHEMLSRTNQLNFTKKRLSLDEVQALIQDSSRKTATVAVRDRFGDHGVVGWYCVHNGSLEHFLFSCRIINLGIEQFVYNHLGRPQLTVIGETASSPFETDGTLDYITLEASSSPVDVPRPSLVDHRKIQIYASGACDMYYLVGTLANALTNVTFECNTFKGETRGVNVGTEYLRSCFEMTQADKDFCHRHFHNYTGQLAFKTSIFEGNYDYALLSFNDDAELFIYEHRASPDLRVLLSESATYSITTVTPPEGRDPDVWLCEEFHCKGLITPERFRENLLWIADRMPSHTKLVLMTLPEHNFFRNNLPAFPQYRRQCLRLNQEIRRLCATDQRFSLVEMNRFITDRSHFTDYIMHLSPERGFLLACEAWRKMAEQPVRTGLVDQLPINGRQIALIGKGLEIEPYELALKAAGVAVSVTATHAVPRDVALMSHSAKLPLVALKNRADEFFAIVSPQLAADSDTLNALGFGESDRWLLQSEVFNLDWKER